jgi:hypothetical protein
MPPTTVLSKGWYGTKVTKEDLSSLAFIICTIEDKSILNCLRKVDRYPAMHPPLILTFEGRGKVEDARRKRKTKDERKHRKCCNDCGCNDLPDRKHAAVKGERDRRKEK